MKGRIGAHRSSLAFWRSATYDTVSTVSAPDVGPVTKKRTELFLVAHNAGHATDVWCARCTAVLKRSRMSRWKWSGVCVAAMVAAIAGWGAAQRVETGGTFRIKVEGVEAPSRFQALFVSRHRPKTSTEFVSLFTSSAGQLPPVVDDREDLPGADRLSSSASTTVAADNAWIAANTVVGNIVTFKVSALRTSSERDDISAATPDASVPHYTLTTPRPLLELRPGLTGLSVGLVSALVYLDTLAAGDLSGGLTVAATGEMARSGAVGSISGVVYKTQAAAAVGADVLFVPDAQLVQAREAGARYRPEMAVVAVGSLMEAAAWLCSHGAVDDVCSTVSS